MAQRQTHCNTSKNCWKWLHILSDNIILKIASRHPGIMT